MGSVAASPDTSTFTNSASKHRTAQQTAAFIASEYVRAQPVTSNYLDTATNPVPWAPSTTPRPCGGRPSLPGEITYAAKL